MNKISSYYKYIYREQLDFRYRLYQLSKISDLGKSIEVAQDLINRAVYSSVGYFASSEIEKPFLCLAQHIETRKDVSFVPQSFLHVMTQAYTTGGHTRVVERWIDSSPISQKHSVVILEQEQKILPERLYVVTSKHKGNVYIFNEKSLLNRAKDLRDIGCEYEYVILHVHMWDPTAIVAFGKEDFKRPVIFFNHADHLFWCGSSVVDMLADLRDNEFASIRGIKNKFSLRIPLEQYEYVYPKSKEQSRKELGLPLNKTIILTVGSPQKYESFEDVDFCSILCKVIDVFSDVVCIGIGPTKSTGTWGKHENSFIPIGSVDYYSQYFDYINACDIYVDSIPVGGGTAKLDALQFNKPVLSFSIFGNPLGEITMGIDTIYDENKFLSELMKLLESKSQRNVMAEQEKSIVYKFHGLDNWTINLNKMIIETPNVHTVNHNFFNGKRVIDDLNVFIAQWMNCFTNKKIDIYDFWHQIKCIGYNG